MELKTLNEYIIEDIKEWHLPKIQEIYNYYVLNTINTFHTHALSIEEIKEMVFLEKPKYKTFVINKNNDICGYMTLTQHKKREAYDDTAEVTIYLKHGVIGKGIGSLGIQYIEKYAKTNSFHVLIASICGENKKSIKLFERNGYKKCAHYKEIGKKFGQLLDVVAYQKII